MRNTSVTHGRIGGNGYAMDGLPVETISSIETNNTQQEPPRSTANKRRIKTQCVATIVVNLANISYGTCVGWPSPTIQTLQSENTPVGESPITEDEASWIGSLMYVGFLCGTPIYSFIADKFGRKTAGLLIAVPAIISWLIIILSNSVDLILLARFITGLSTGGVFLTVPIYVGEICEDDIRGTLGSFFAIFGHLGILFSYAVGSSTLYHEFAIICLAIPVLFFAIFMFMPETPIYLMGKGEIKKAKRSLKWLRGGTGKDITEELTKMSLLLKDIHERNASRNLIKDLLLDQGSRRALVIGVSVCSMQMLSGFYAIVSYVAIIFQKTGNDIPTNTSTIIVGSVLLAATILACPLMDRAGRKVLLVSSEIAMGICLIGLGVYFYLQDQGFDMSTVGFIPVVCLGLHLFFYGVGIGPVAIVIMSEIFLPHVRSTATSICTFVMAFLAFLVTRFYGDLNNAIGIYGSYWFFAACCFLGAIFAITSIPETKNRNVNSIYAELSEKRTSIIPVKKSYNMNIPEKCKYVR